VEEHIDLEDGLQARRTQFCNDIIALDLYHVPLATRQAAV
jgi:hypothetical protein